MNVVNKILKVLSDLLFIAGLLIAGLFLVGHFTGFKPFQAYIVSSGSMEPAIKTGSVVIVSPKSQYQTGDVVTFFTASDKKATTTHRIVGIDDQVFRTSGDANNQPDMAILPVSHIIGKVRFSVPYLGYLAAEAKTPKGFILFVIVPATIIVYEELKSLFSEIRKGLKKIKLIPLHKAEGSQSEIHNSSLLLKPAVILPVFGAGLVLLTLSGSFFYDRVTSTNNSFTAWTPTPTPTPLPIATTLVMNEVLPVSSCTSGQTPGQFVELWNGLEVTANLKDYQLSDGISTIAVANSNTNLPSHEFAILVKSAGVINQCLGDIPDVVTVNLGGQIDLNKGTLYLQDSGGATIDAILWAPTNPEPTGLPQPTPDQSFERNPTGLDSAYDSAFNPYDFIIQTTPSPGTGL